jgi:hypothetical protein
MCNSGNSCSCKWLGMAILKREIERRAPLGLKPVAVFEVSEADYPRQPAGQGRRLLRDPAGLPILRQIAEALSKRGYRATEVKQARGIEAGFGCSLSGKSEISIILGVSRRGSGFISCDLITYYSPSWLDRWRGRSALPDKVVEWNRLCEAINEELIGALHAASVLWQTEAEASERWKDED